MGSVYQHNPVSLTSKIHIDLGFCLVLCIHTPNTPVRLFVFWIAFNFHICTYGTAKLEHFINKLTANGRHSIILNSQIQLGNAAIVITVANILGYMPFLILLTNVIRIRLD